MERVFLHLPTIRLIGLALFASLLILSEFTVWLEGERHYELHRSQVLQDASTLRAELEGYINSTLNLTQGVVIYVANHPDLSQSDFETVAAQVIEASPYIRNIGLARDNVISHIYPLQGNEAALGLDYLNNPEQRDAVLRAINSKKTTVAGPVALVQGGSGFISRTPIYSPRLGERGRPAYWGLASVVLRADKLLFVVDRKSRLSGIEYALRGRDGLGPEGEVFYGDGTIFEHSPIVLDVTLPKGSWQLAAVPAQGWRHYTPRVQFYRLMGILLALLISYLVYWLLQQRLRITAQALHDPLTALPNRRLFNDRLDYAITAAQRNGKGFSLLYIDLDDFKPVNDLYGHKVGDRVLVKVANRLRECIRESDTLARIGGDEFMLILPETGEVHNATTVASKVIEQLQQPFGLGDDEVRIGASIGISRYPDDGKDADTLMRHADQAMYVSKERGKGSYNFYNSDWVVLESGADNSE